MSIFCFCVINNIEESEEKKNVFQQIEKLAQKYNCAIHDSIDWQEPIMSEISRNSYVISIDGSQKGDNCELFLLPDGWYYNNKTNMKPFVQRAKFFGDIAEMLLKERHAVSFYIAQSGTNIDEFENHVIHQSELSEFISESIGKNGVDAGLYIQVI